MSHESMTRSEMAERLEFHRREAESALTRAAGYDHYGATALLSEANAHASLAIFYQGELREAP